MSTVSPAPTKASDAVLARRLVVEPHTNADALEIARVDDYVSIVRKGQFRTGDLAVYIPEGMLVPEELLVEMGLWDAENAKGRLAGREGRRVKAIRLRGVLSQGLVLTPKAIPSLVEGEDYAEALGITKWVPQIPVDLQAALVPCPAMRAYTDIENAKRFPDVFVDGEEVIAVEKGHGSCCCVLHTGAETFVSSRGRAQSRLALVDERDEHGRSRNAYWRSVHLHDIPAKLARIADELGTDELVLYGETLGVQDLRYGLAGGAVDFRAFDLRVGEDFLDHDELTRILEAYEIPAMPVIYRGPYSKGAIAEATDGREQLSGTEANIREGVVVRPAIERTDDVLGRVIVKSISDAYLVRGGETTEFN